MPRAGRRALFLGIAGAGVAGAAALTGCRSRSSHAAQGSSPAPTPAKPRTTIVFYAKPPNANTNAQTLIRIMQEVLAPYYAQHPTIDVHLIPSELPTQTIVAGILAGEPMDIIYDNYFAPYYEQQLVLPLRDYFQRDSVDTKIWNPAQFALYDTPAGPMGIPVYTGTTVYVVNQNLFDNLGYTYPSPAWTHQDFLTISRQVTPVGKGRAFGSNIFWYTSGASQQASWVFRAFGGHQVSPTGAPSQLGSAPNLAALRWLYEGLFWPKIGAPQDAIGASDFVAGRLGLLMMSTWELLSFAMTLKGPSLKWDFLPNPVFPAGRATFCTADFYAIAANTKHPNECWDLLNWVSVQPDWQRATFKYALRSPALNTLWDEWAQTVQSVVPFFTGKTFSWFGDAASKGYAYPVEYYPHDDQRVWSLIGPYFTELYDQKFSTVEAAASQIDHVVNGFDANAQAAEAQLAQAGRRFPTQGPEIATVPSGV